MNLLIISNMAHYLRQGEVVGWGPTVQEIDHLAALFETIRLVGCLHDAPAPDSALPYQSGSVTLVPLPAAGGSRLIDKLRIITYLPVYLRTIARELRNCDAVHLRCPANIPLLALVTLIFTHKPLARWAKYAGNWDAGSHSPVFYRLQRWILQTGVTRCEVSVNGTWAGQKRHIHSFYNPCLTVNELRRAAEDPGKDLGPTLRLVFVGALNPHKGILRLLEIARRLKQEGLPFTLDILGDGPDRRRYESFSREHGLSGQIRFRGWLAKHRLAEYYRNAHILILPSESEGWPKVISEGMAHGVVPVAGAVGSIPEILRDTRAGVAVFPYDHADEYVKAVLYLFTHPDELREYSTNALKAAGLFTYEKYQDAVRELFIQAWNIHLPEDETEGGK